MSTKLDDLKKELNNLVEMKNYFEYGKPCCDTPCCNRPWCKESAGKGKYSDLLWLYGGLKEKIREKFHINSYASILIMPYSVGNITLSKKLVDNFCDKSIKKQEDRVAEDIDITTGNIHPTNSEIKKNLNDKLKIKQLILVHDTSLQYGSGHNGPRAPKEYIEDARRDTKDKNPGLYYYKAKDNRECKLQSPCYIPAFCFYPTLEGFVDENFKVSDDKYRGEYELLKEICGKIPNELKEIIIIKEIDEKHEKQLNQLITKIEANLDNKQFWLPISKIARDHFFDKKWTRFVGVFDEEILIGAGALFLNENEYGESIKHVGIPNNHIAELGMLMVDPLYRGKNIAFMISKKVEEMAKNENIKTLIATVYPNNIPSKKNLIKLGYVKVGHIIKSEDYERDIMIKEI